MAKTSRRVGTAFIVKESDELVEIISKAKQELEVSLAEKKSEFEDSSKALESVSKTLIGRYGANIEV